MQPRCVASRFVCCSQTMNPLPMHFSEGMPVVKWCMTVQLLIFGCIFSFSTAYMYVFVCYIQTGVVLCKKDTVKGGILDAYIMTQESNEWNAQEQSQDVIRVHCIVILLLYLEEGGKRKGSQYLLCTRHAQALWYWEALYPFRVDLSAV